MQDFIFREFSRFAEEIDELDPSVPKPRGHVFTRRAVADFVAFFTICACFGSFVMLSAKCAKEEETRYNPPPRPATPESEGYDKTNLFHYPCTEINHKQTKKYKYEDLFLEYTKPIPNERNTIVYK